MRTSFLFVFLALSASTLAQDMPRQWILGLDLDATKYYGDFTDNRFSSGGLLSAKRFVARLGNDAIYTEAAIGSYDLQWRVTREFFRVYDTTALRIGDKNRAFVVPLRAQILWRRMIGPRADLFLGTGLEVSYFSVQDPNGASLDRPQDHYGHWTAGIPLSAEFAFLLSEDLAFNIHATFHTTFTDYLDGFKAGSGTDAYMTMGFGIRYAFPVPVADSDYDGLTDEYENGVSHTNPYDRDTDGDGLSDKEEVDLGTNPMVIDTDHDGLTDGDEVHRFNTNPLAKDSDGDGLNDMEEIERGTNPMQIDTDSDGLNDKEEIARGTDPLVRDTDGDGLPDGLERISSPLLRDTDGDGLNDDQELALGLQPQDEDFDRDGLFDGLEVRIGTDPKKADTDNDGASDYVEYYCLMTDPRNPDTDGDGIPDGSDPTPLDGTPLNPARNVTWSLYDIFLRDGNVDDKSKGFLLLLHLIRSAPRDMLSSVDVTVYGSTTNESRQRRQHLQDLLSRQTVNWSKPPLVINSEVKPVGSADARITYDWKAGLGTRQEDRTVEPPKTRHRKR